MKLFKISLVRTDDEVQAIKQCASKLKVMVLKAIYKSNYTIIPHIVLHHQSTLSTQQPLPQIQRIRKKLKVQTHRTTILQTLVHLSRTHSHQKSIRNHLTSTAQKI